LAGSVGNCMVSPKDPIREALLARGGGRLGLLGLS
jgi:hypothetical protein